MEQQITPLSPEATEEAMRLPVPDAMIRFNRDLRVLYASPAIEEVVGLRSEALLSRSLGSAGLPDSFVRPWETALRDVLQTRQFQEIEFTGGKEGERAFQTRLFAELSGGEVTTILTITRDITERKQKEADLTTQTMTLEKALQAAEQTAQRSPELIASFTHELRTPLNGVIGMTHLLLDTELTPAQRELAEMAQTSAQALMAVINDTLDLSRMEAGQLHFNAAPFDLRDVVEEVGEILAARAEEKSLNLILRCAPNLPSRLMGDAARIRQALLNLTDNAVKFTSQGYVLLDAACDDIIGQEARIRIEIEDTGIGIASEDQNRIFDRFSQGEPNAVTRSQGTGLGLTISRQLVEWMGGSIEVASEPNKGSRFRLLLRLPVEEAGTPPSPPLALAGMRVLVVEGPRLQQFALHELLTAWGMRSSLCSKAQEMPEAFRSGITAGDPYQFALLDDSLNPEDRLDVMQALRNDSALHGTRLVLLTSISRLAKAQQRQEAGIGACMAKPIRHAKLRETLLGLLEPTPLPPVTASPMMATPDPETENTEAASHPEPSLALPAMPERSEAPEALLGTPTSLEVSQDQTKEDVILDGAALLARIDNEAGALRSLVGVYQIDSARLMVQIREAISLGDRYEFLDLTHKLRGILVGLEAKASVEALRRLETTAAEGRPADADALLPVLAEELSRLYAALTQMVKDLEAARS